MAKCPDCKEEMTSRLGHSFSCPAKKAVINRPRAGQPTPSRLAQLETVIDRGREAFLEMGRALAEIKDTRLYKERGFTSFEEYCQSRWGFTRIRAHQLIEGAEVANLLTTVNKPTNERQARELVRVAKRISPEAVAEVWERAGPKPTSESIRAAAQPPLEPTYEIEQSCGHYYVCSKCGNVQP